VKKIKLAHVVNNAMGRGGVSTVAYHLLKRLSDERYERYLYSLKFDESGSTAQDGRINRFEEIGIKASFGSQDIKKPFDVGSLAQWLLDHQIDILHTHSYRPNIIGRLAAVLCGKMKIVGHYHNHYDNKWEKDDSLIFDQLLAPFSDQLIACSGSVQKHISERVGVPPEKIEVVLNGVDLDRFKPCEDPISLKREMGLPLDRKVIGVVGRISEQKGQDDFIKAAHLIKKAIPNTIFLIVGQTGDDSLRTGLTELAAAQGVDKDVIFTGHIPDVHRVYSVLDILVVPSRWEGLALVWVEGMASGKPIVATNVGAILEVVVQNETALLVPPSIPSSIASSVIRLLKNPEEARTMGEKGRERAEMFSWDRSAMQLDNLYKKMMEESRICP
jgi:glycosyltransferase involved in cell wall biosynthesis